MAKLIGTSGHVDHGKTSLIRALTGIDADRLPEEARRGMTIDIGFARITLPGFPEVSIVDVPGHERFLSNMLVGALGIDLALLCVAADEAVMPQTREHLQILDLLPVTELVVALTKADLADQEQRELATLEVQEMLNTTRFAGAPIVPVSAETGEGLDELRAALVSMLSQGDDGGEGTWYLPIDRCFTVKGHGLVVTGTLMRGRVFQGDEAVVQPGGETVRVKAIHGHGTEKTEAEKGQRTGLNLVGPGAKHLERGRTVGSPGTVLETSVMDVEVRWLKRPAHARRVRVSIGADEAVAKAFHSDPDPDVVQLRLERPVAAVRGQPLIIRDYSPPVLLGGGSVLLPVAEQRRKSAAPPRVSQSEGVTEILEGRVEGLESGELARLLGTVPAALGDELSRLESAGEIVRAGSRWFTSQDFEELCEEAARALARLHGRFPERAAFDREQLLRELGAPLPRKVLDPVLSRMVKAGSVQLRGAQIGLTGHGPQLNPRQREMLDRIVAELDSLGASVPDPQGLADSLRVPVQTVTEMTKVGIAAGELVRIGDGIVYSVNGVQALADQARLVLGERGFAASDFRDALGTSRRWAIPLLEHFDATGITLRQGDKRVFR
ncbi:MAG: selenocysteine-specific translation elongation factor [Fimbriimonadaceae bacterium]